MIRAITELIRNHGRGVWGSYRRISPLLLYALLYENLAEGVGRLLDSFREAQIVGGVVDLRALHDVLRRERERAGYQSARRLPCAYPARVHLCEHIADPGSIDVNLRRKEGVETI